MNNKIIDEIILLNNKKNDTLNRLKTQIEHIMNDIKNKKDINYVNNQLKNININKDIKKMNIQIKEIKYNNDLKFNIINDKNEKISSLKSNNEIICVYNKQEDEMKLIYCMIIIKISKDGLMKIKNDI